MEKQFSAILELDNVIIAITILLRVQKRWKNCAGKAGFTFSFNNGKIIDFKITTKI